MDFKIILPFLTSMFLFLIAFGQVDTNFDQLIREQKYETLIREGKKKLEYEGKNPEVSMVVGRSLFYSGKIDEAIPYLEAAIEEPNHKTSIDAWAMGCLGKIYFLKGEYEKSKESLIMARSLNATKNATHDAQKALLLLGFEDIYDAWETFETDHIIFHIQDTEPLGDVAAYIYDRTQAYREIQQFYGSELPKKIDFFIWKDQLTGYRFLKENLGFSKPELCLTHSFAFQTPGHELTRIISHYSVPEFIEKTKFINEGMAVAFDQTSRNRLNFAKKSLKKSKLKKISIESIWKNPDSVLGNILYAVSGAFVEYLIEEGGRKKFLELLPNQTYESAKAIYGEKLDKIIADFEKKLRGK